MTWKRIDENTYIDDTLVTCAEYQLLIEEVRYEGNFLNPDHWYSYQFSLGQARESILGLQSSDAITFCNWLASRGGSEWDYRLPRLAEVTKYPLRLPTNDSAVSYWILDTDGIAPLVWNDKTENYSPASGGIRLVKEWRGADRAAKVFSIVDNKLVSCAEYQLFIDEMRKQGKYHQPDHWTSYQFPVEQAREPIMGIRLDDAMNFCKWLTIHEADEWKYRLPTQLEAIEHPSTINLQPQGYWTKPDSPLNYENFAWCSVPYTLERYLDRKIILLELYDRVKNLARLIDRPLDSLPDDVTAALANGVDEQLNAPRPLTLEVISDPELTRSLESPINLEYYIYRSLQRNWGLTAHLYPDSSGLGYLPMKQYLDLIVLGERLAERLPAVEGIRLVKELIT